MCRLGWAGLGTGSSPFCVTVVGASFVSSSNRTVFSVANRGGVQRFTRAAEMSRGTKGTSPGAWQAVPSHCHRSMFQWAQRASHSCQRLQMRVGPGPAMRVGRSRWYEAISHFPSTETHLCCTRLCILHNLYRQLRNGRLS